MGHNFLSRSCEPLVKRPCSFFQIDLHRIKNELEEKLASECLAGDEAEKVFRLNAEKESLVQFNKKLKTQLRLIKNALAKQDGQRHSATLEGDWVVVHQDK